MRNELTIIWNKLESWYVELIDMMPNILVALLIFISVFYVARGIKYVFIKFLLAKWQNEELKAIFGKIIQITVVILGFLFALSVVNLDKTVTSILAGVGVVGLALGFAFQDIAANFISGVFMASNKPFSIGDSIEINGMSGIVQAIKLRTTEIRTFDGNDLIIPNRQVFQNPIKNYTSSPSRRIDLAVGVSYSDDLQKVKELVINTINSMDGIISDREVNVFFNEFGGSSINFEVQFWIPHTLKGDFLKFRSNAIQTIKTAFDKENISIPFPITTLDVSGTSPILMETMGSRKKIEDTDKK